MKIIQAHKFYWYRDGASNYALFLSELLRNKGHEVIPFAMQNPKNLDSAYGKFFVSGAELDDPSQVSLSKKIKYAGRMFYSCEAKHKMKALLRSESVDIVHLHNIYHHISPSILPVIKKKGIPIVMTLHDYKLICPNYTMFHHGAVHEEDCGGWYGSCVKNKCMKDNKMQSRIVRAEMIFHHKIMKYYERYVDKFIAPSRFMMGKCIEMGWGADRFVNIANPISDNRYQIANNKKDKGYVAYVGRLSEEKGVEVLIEASKLTPEIDYKIIGEGPLLSNLKSKIKNQKSKNVELTGFQTGKKLESLIKGARIIAVPSIWYENYPLSILEGKAMGKIVIGSKIGGIPEMLPSSMLVPAGDAKKFADRISKWFNKPTHERVLAGNKLKAEVKKINDPEEHVERVIEVYKALLE